MIVILQLFEEVRSLNPNGLEGEAGSLFEATEGGSRK
jgi:hypothetical protein